MTTKRRTRAFYDRRGQCVGVNDLMRDEHMPLEHWAVLSSIKLPALTVMPPKGSRCAECNRCLTRSAVQVGPHLLHIKCMQVAMSGWLGVFVVGSQPARTVN